MPEEITLQNGVWIHETEWAAIKELIRSVSVWMGSADDDDRWGDTRKYTAEVEDAFDIWKNVHMDIAEETRAIQTLTKIVGDLSVSVDDDVSSDPMT